MKSQILGMLAVGLMAGSMAANAVGVVVGGKEWRQLTESVNFSWYQVATVCNPTTGACSGSIGAVSFDGWTWATTTDVQGLFEQLILPATVQFPSTTTFYQAVNSADIDAAIGAGAFQATGVETVGEYVWGWTGTQAFDQWVSYDPYLSDYFASGFTDYASLNSIATKTEARQDKGVWLFRPVPEPGSSALLVLGLIAMGATRRRLVPVRPEG